MATLHQHPSAMPPMPAVARILGQFDRERLSGFIECAIALLDIMDPDPESEDSEGHLIDAKGRWTGDDWTAAQFYGNREPDDPDEDSDQDEEHDGKEHEQGHSCLTYGVNQDGPIFTNDGDAADTYDATPVRVHRPILRLKHPNHD